MLALQGGSPVSTKKFEWNSTIDERDEQAVLEVMRSGELSGFYGSPGDRFLGGAKVRAFDRAWAERFGVKHAVSVNSNSSGLYAAMAAIGIGPGDEVIVTPLSMAVSAICPIPYGGLPVFADVEPETLILEPESIERQVTERTKAIVVVNLLGQAAELDRIVSFARARGIKVIEDNAQAPGALYKGREVGTIGDIGIYSLNCHKAVQTGEGGVVVTNDDDYGEALQLVRNHAESVVEGVGRTDLTNMVGWNYRMTELQAAIGLVQLSKLDQINSEKQEKAEHLNEVLKSFPFLSIPSVRPESTHVYYLYMLRYDPTILGIARDRFSEALRAEGFNASLGYVKPIYLQPLFQKKIAIGPDGWPFTATDRGRSMRYERGLCPVAERLHFEECFYPDLIRYKISGEDIQNFARAVEKVAEHAEALKG